MADNAVQTGNSSDGNSNNHTVIAAHGALVTYSANHMTDTVRISKETMKQPVVKGVLNKAVGHSFNIVCNQNPLSDFHNSVTVHIHSIQYDM